MAFKFKTRTFREGINAVTVDITDIEVVLTPYPWAGAIIVEWGHMDPKLNWNFITCKDEEEAKEIYDVLVQYARVKMTTARKDKIEQRTKELFKEFTNDYGLGSITAESIILLRVNCRNAAINEQILEELIMQREAK